MNEISLLFYGWSSEVASPLLQKLNVLEVRAPTDDLNGYYVLENRFGKELLRKVNLDLDESSSDDWLIYKYLTEQDIESLKSVKGQRRIFVLLQNFINLDDIINLKLGEHSFVHFIVGRAEDHFRTPHFVTTELKTKNIFHIKKIKRNEAQKTKEANFSQVPWILLFFLKLLLNPVDELGRVSRALKYSNLRILSRFVEFLQFVHFVIKMFVVHVLKYSGIKLFWGFIHLGGVSRVSSIKLKYFIKHVFLMTIYKAWGLLVDTGQFLVRFKDWVVMTTYYKSLHFIYHKKLKPALTWLWTKVLVPVFYGWIHYFYHNHVKKALTYIWVNVLVGTFYFLLDVLYYKGIHLFYHKYVKFAMTWLWTKILIPVFYDRIHYFYHNYVKRALTYIWVNVLVGTFYFLLDVLYYKGIHLFYHKIIKEFATFIWMQLVVRFYHQILKKLATIVWVKFLVPIFFGTVNIFYYNGFHRLYHQVFKRALTFAWLTLVLPLFYGFIFRLYNQLRIILGSVWGYLIVPLYYQIIMKVVVAVHLALKQLFYFILQKLFYDGLLKFYYRVLKNYLYYRFFGWLKGVLFMQVKMFFMYTLRHFFLMTAYKTYGFSYDFVMLLRRITKLYLLYPVFKIFWFSKFQYNKRIKKYFIS